MGLDPELTETLLEFCDETGITKAFWSLLVNDSPLVPGSFSKIRLRDHDWYIQRPGLKWASNTHWISPFDERTHIEFLKVLSKGGFDKVLHCIGKKFGFDGLVAYHLSFIGVSHCSKGYMHNDITDVAGKGFNLIIPLILATDSGPELELEQWDNQAIIGKYKYKLNEANMVGDSVAHATAACDYLAKGEMRMAATVYIADVNSENVEQVAAYFTQKYPPQDDFKHLLDRAGSHWQRDDPTKRLPTRVEPLLF
ncbi:hypothetical protein MHU86_10738 [Fragilaria crotonensis]|nr:hypothetical protein MHU86_10738 [Fragilaria crotonensis]